MIHILLDMYMSNDSEINEFMETQKQIRQSEEIRESQELKHPKFVLSYHFITKIKLLIH